MVLQLLSAGAEYQRAALISALQTCDPDCAIYDRSDVAVRKKEGMALTQGPVTGELPPALLPIEEHGMKLLVDIQGGHKTGYYGCRQVVSVDTSQDALDIARQNVELNQLDLSKAEFVRDDVFKLLRAYREHGEKFDVIIMDPPKFVENKSQLMGACRGYKDINMLAADVPPLAARAAAVPVRSGASAAAVPVPPDDAGSRRPVTARAPRPRLRYAPAGR
ncbi:23S rRNA methyltransferase [Salmonella enterica subsp. enterica serovar Enteritidis str. SA19940857]|nr:23S rRNA methyltransferase [Salmonella enterica subsp. enterica serovar Enteritidis str. SA19940857]